jgi:hypothetical protein
VTIATGNNNDVVNLFDFSIDNQVVVNSGNGNDDVLIEDFDAGQGDGPRGTRGAAT